jgi:hypothetical protein
MALEINDVYEMVTEAMRALLSARKDGRGWEKRRKDELDGKEERGELASFLPCTPRLL